MDARAAHALPAERVARHLETDRASGLAAPGASAREPLATRSLGPVEAALCIAFALAPFVAIEFAKTFMPHPRRSGSVDGTLVVGCR
jgi:hypothetical protein